MRREDVQRGLLIKLLKNYQNVPAGTWATVDGIGTWTGGRWFFNVRWCPYTPLPDSFLRKASQYSLNFFEEELTLFDLVTPEEQEAARKPPPEPPVALMPRKQLLLPFPED